MDKQEWFTVKEIADIAGVSRQTLIYYDTIGLFKPEQISENGYRKYSADQIMQLREILFLKEKNIPLEFIKENLRKRDVGNVKDILRASKEKLTEDIEKMNRRVEQLNNRIHLYERASIELYTVSIPLIKYFPERYIYYMPWESENLDRSILYKAFMQARSCLDKYHISDDLGWGSMIRLEHIQKPHWLRNGGGCINLSEQDVKRIAEDDEHVVTLPAGEYLCMNKFGMPFERQPVDDLLSWVAEHEVKITGDIIDDCLLDTTFSHIADSTVDFSQLQVCIDK